MRAAVEARRKALASIAKPKLEDYLAHCDKLTLDLVASFQRAIVEDLVGKTLAAAEPAMWPRCSSPEASRPTRNCVKPSNARAPSKACPSTSPRVRSRPTTRP